MTEPVNPPLAATAAHTAELDAMFRPLAVLADVDDTLDALMYSRVLTRALTTASLLPLVAAMLQTPLLDATLLTPFVELDWQSIAERSTMSCVTPRNVTVAEACVDDTTTDAMPAALPDANAPDRAVERRDRVTAIVTSPTSRPIAADDDTAKQAIQATARLVPCAVAAAVPFSIRSVTRFIVALNDGRPGPDTARPAATAMQLPDADAIDPGMSDEAVNVLDPTAAIVTSTIVKVAAVVAVNAVHVIPSAEVTAPVAVLLVLFSDESRAISVTLRTVRFVAVVVPSTTPTAGPFTAAMLQLVTWTMTSSTFHGASTLPP